MTELSDRANKMKNNSKLSKKQDTTSEIYKKLAEYYQGAKALIFPQEEDFGIVALEAQAAGTPVVAFKAGGALDTIIEGKTGIFFDKPTKESLIGAVKKLERTKFKKYDLINNAERFTKEKFKKNFFELIKY